MSTVLAAGRRALVRRRTAAGVHEQRFRHRDGNLVPVREPARRPAGADGPGRHGRRRGDRGLQQACSLSQRDRLHPAPVRDLLDGLGSLLEEIGRAGLPVRLHVNREPFPLPAAIDLSAYRIVQEGLTNALKHARASHADVTVRYGSDSLQTEIRDNAIGAATSDGLGHGLPGIRERVKIYGGEMTAGTANGGGFILSTRLPLSSDLP